MDKISLGDRMKAYEMAYTHQRTMPLLPVIARLDGRAFHSWTKGLQKPFDEDFIAIMQSTAKELMSLTGALVAYTQSDEITLIFHSDDLESQIFFDGKIFKMTSVLASMCTAAFNLSVQRRVGKSWLRLLSKPPGTFDCRVFQVPNKTEACNCLIWREQDAVRNSILTLAQSKFSVKEMHGKSTSELQEMMFQKDETNWNDLSTHLKRGTYYQKVVLVRKFTADEISKLPEKHAARINPDLEVSRTDIVQQDFPRLTQIANLDDVIFNGSPVEYKYN